MEKPIVTALLAYGMSGRVFHAPFISLHEGFVFKGVLEHNTKKVQQDYPNIKSFDTLEEVLSDPQIELIIVNTPSNTHVEYSRRALEAGKHILVEKPFAPTAAEAKDIFELGKKVGKKVLVYQNRRWSSDFKATRDVIRSGRLGRIIEMHLRYDRFRPEIGPKAFKENPLPASGIMYDLAAHLLDQAICLFGKPERYRKTKGIFRDNSKVDDYGNVHLLYADQTNVFITTSLLVADPLPGIVVHGTKGSFIKSFCDTQEDQLLAGQKPDAEGFGEEASNKQGRLSVSDGRGGITLELIPSQKGDYINLFESVFQSIRHAVPFPVKEEEVLCQIEILES